MKIVNLSPSKLNLFNDCPRCFYDAYALKCPRPRGIFPTLPSGMDRVIKEYMDQFRGTLPPMLIDRVKGQLMFDIEKLNKWRNWRTGLEYIDTVRGIRLIGALDDCLEGEIGYIPIDWKTKGKKPADDGSQYYQTQLDCYNLMLYASGYKVLDMGYLVYFYPEALLNGRVATDIRFGTNVYEIKCNVNRASEIIIKAAECLRGERPLGAADCEYCGYAENRNKL